MNLSSSCSSVDFAGAGVKTVVAVNYCIIFRNIFYVASIDFHSSFRGELYVAIQNVLSCHIPRVDLIISIFVSLTDLHITRITLYHRHT
jgi:hypothetical protein